MKAYETTIIAAEYMKAILDGNSEQTEMKVLPIWNDISVTIRTYQRHFNIWETEDISRCIIAAKKAGIPNENTWHINVDSDGNIFLAYQLLIKEEGE